MNQQLKGPQSYMEQLLNMHSLLWQSTQLDPAGLVAIVLGCGSQAQTAVAGALGSGQWFWRMQGRMSAACASQDNKTCDHRQCQLPVWIHVRPGTTRRVIRDNASAWASCYCLKKQSPKQVLLASAAWHALWHSESAALGVCNAAVTPNEGRSSNLSGA